MNTNISYFKTDLEIKEDSNCKINKLKIKGDIEGIKQLCGSFENLIEFDLYVNNQIRNIEKVLPLFKYESKIIFKSLTIFKLLVGFLDIYSLCNISNNLNNMPNFKHFELFCSTEGNYEYLEQIYEALNKLEKAMLKKLKYIKIDIKINTIVDEESIDNNGKSFIKNKCI